MRRAAAAHFRADWLCVSIDWRCVKLGEYSPPDIAITGVSVASTISTRRRRTVVLYLLRIVEDRRTAGLLTLRRWQRRFNCGLASLLFNNCYLVLGA